ncbi:LpqN/LpqT family lipoprotein [Mycobacterium sp. OTB74]|jgi:hypothetical protein|uniref:LpqN/LpqT family lipoprotein n=1 Tax=Mycobacterium sp. OTB74 TaxID=1853452 RepID=UPI00247652A2|nr:LpqN/LpqT family lipoprotein [Mycobacterium sp. OTB74]
MVAIIGGAVVVVVAVVVAGILLTGNDDKSTPGTQTSASAKPSASPTANKTSPVLVGTPGNYQTIATYLKSNNIVETPVHRGDPGTPGVILPMPAGWVDAGNQTPQFAYQSIIYTGPAAGNYRPSATALIFRLGPNAEADKIIDFAAGELYNLSGFSPTDAGSTTTFAGHQAFQVAGTWNLNGIAKMIVQRTVIIQDPTGLYVMQINIDGLADQSDIITRITEAIDRDTKITEG